MTAIEVLIMLKKKIDRAARQHCTYTIETDDTLAINQALNEYATTDTGPAPDFDWPEFG